MHAALDPAFHEAARTCAGKGLWAAAGLPSDGGDTLFRISASVDGSGRIGKLTITRGGKAGQPPNEAELRLLLCLTEHTRAGVKGAALGPGKPRDVSMAVTPK